MVAVLAIAYGRHCEDESCLWETVADELYGFVEVGGALGDGQLPLLKQALELCDSSVDCHTSHDRSEPSIMTGSSHLL